jgi:hypothetical protein
MHLKRESQDSIGYGRLADPNRTVRFDAPRGMESNSRTRLVTFSLERIELSRRERNL